jgi:hypothetical protein
LPSGDNVVGTSAIRSLLVVALTSFFKGEFHAGGLQVEREDGVAFETAQPRSRSRRKGWRRRGGPGGSGAGCRNSGAGAASRRAGSRRESGCPSPVGSPGAASRQEREIAEIVAVAHDQVAAARGADAAPPRKLRALAMQAASVSALLRQALKWSARTRRPLSAPSGFVRQPI